MAPQPVEDQPTRVLIPFGSPFLYGMERAVIELFDSVRPDVEPDFLVSTLIADAGLPVTEEIRRRGLRHTMMSDRTDWPRVGKPRSISHLAAMLRGLILANVDALRASADKDIIYVSNLLALLNSLLACLVFRGRRKRVVYAFHDLVVDYPWLMRAAGIAVSEYVYQSVLSAEWLQARLPHLSRKKWTVIPHVIDLRVGKRMSATLASTRRHIVFGGQVAPHKGPDFLLAAFAALASQYPDVDLHIVGGPAEGAFADVLRQRRDAHGLNDRVYFWGYRDDLLDIVQEAYIYVQPSRPSLFHEAAPRGVVEAMGLGVPAVVFRSGGLQEAVLDGQTGVICEEESVQCLAEALKTFLGDREFHDRCAVNAKKHYELMYAPERVVARWRRFFTGRCASS